jgi:hypothetical protein
MNTELFCGNCGKPKNKFNIKTGEENKTYCDNVCCGGKHVYVERFWSTVCIKCGRKKSYFSVTEV